MFRGFIAGLSTTLLLAAIGIYFVVITGTINPGADQPIPPIERWAATTSLRAYLSRNTPKVKNPVAVTEANLHQGVDLYIKNCAACHGFADGKKTAIARGMYKLPNTFAREDWSKEEDGLIFWFINHGVRLTGMPAYGKTFTDEEQWKLVLLIKNMESLPPATDKYWRSFEGH